MNNHTRLDWAKFAKQWFGQSMDTLDDAEAKALQHAARREASTEDPLPMLEAQETLGERMADRVASFGGSWTFISLFGALLLVWIVLNTEILSRAAFDPYPYIFLNLVLSMLAAIQAPIIMMSQNRLATRDRQMASHDYEVNLKAEIEIMALHEKLEQLRTDDLERLLVSQQKQLDMLGALLAAAQR